MNLRVIYYDKAGEVKYKVLHTDSDNIHEHERLAKDFVAKEGGKYIKVQIVG